MQSANWHILPSIDYNIFMNKINISPLIEVLLIWTLLMIAIWQILAKIERNICIAKHSFSKANLIQN